MTVHDDRDEPVFRGTRVAPRGRRQMTARQGRVCAEPGCRTVLSVYNFENTCWRHAPVHAYHVRGHRSGGRAA
ncbi:MAG TPA: hypothetical protein VF984_12730 [Actinomycetota bacterium]